MPLQEVMQKTTVSEFTEWLVFFEMEARDYSTLNNMLAKLCAEVRRSWVKDPKKVDPRQFLPTFAKIERAPQAPVDVEEKTRQSKAFWGALLGVSDV